MIWALLCFCAGPVMAEQITVYTTSFLPVAHSEGTHITVHTLDAPDAPLAALSAGLPDTYEAATPVALALIRSPQGRRLLGELKRAYQAVIDAWLNGIEALPAILIDGRYLLYGVYDVNEALVILDEHQARRRR